MNLTGGMYPPILCQEYGEGLTQEIYQLKATKNFVGMGFLDCVLDIYTTSLRRTDCDVGAVLVGVLRTGSQVTAPRLFCDTLLADSEFVVEQGDWFFLIGEDRESLEWTMRNGGSSKQVIVGPAGKKSPQQPGFPHDAGEGEEVVQELLGQSMWIKAGIEVVVSAKATERSLGRSRPRKRHAAGNRENSSTNQGKSPAPSRSRNSESDSVFKDGGRGIASGRARRRGAGLGIRNHSIASPSKRDHDIASTGIPEEHSPFQGTSTEKYSLKRSHDVTASDHSISADKGGEIDEREKTTSGEEDEAEVVEEFGDRIFQSPEEEEAAEEMKEQEEVEREKKEAAAVEDAEQLGQEAGDIGTIPEPAEGSAAEQSESSSTTNASNVEVVSDHAEEERGPLEEGGVEDKEGKVRDASPTVVGKTEALEQDEEPLRIQTSPAFERKDVPSLPTALSRNQTAPHDRERFRTSDTPESAPGEIRAEVSDRFPQPNIQLETRNAITPVPGRPPLPQPHKVYGQQFLSPSSHAASPVQDSSRGWQSSTPAARSSSSTAHRDLTVQGVYRAQHGSFAPTFGIPVEVRDHLVICAGGWTNSLPLLLRPLLNHGLKADIVVVGETVWDGVARWWEREGEAFAKSAKRPSSAPKDRNTAKKPHLPSMYFVEGKLTSAMVLIAAGVERARKVIVLGSRPDQPPTEEGEHHLTDADPIFSTMLLENRFGRLNPALLYGTVTEFVNDSNVKFLRSTKEIIQSDIEAALDNESGDEKPSRSKTGYGGRRDSSQFELPLTGAHMYRRRPNAPVVRDRRRRYSTDTNRLSTPRAIDTLHGQQQRRHLLQQYKRAIQGQKGRDFWGPYDIGTLSEGTIEDPEKAVVPPKGADEGSKAAWLKRSRKGTFKRQVAEMAPRRMRNDVEGGIAKVSLPPRTIQRQPKAALEVENQQEVARGGVGANADEHIGEAAGLASFKWSAR